jgi:hypothetical protein
MRRIVAIFLSIGLLSDAGCAYTLDTGNRKVDRAWNKAENAAEAPAQCFLVTAATGLWLWCNGSSNADSDLSQDGSDNDLRKNRDNQETPDGPEGRPLLPQVR